MYFCIFLCRFCRIFPRFSSLFRTVLLVPGSIALILISIRSSFMLLNIMDKIINCLGYFIYGITGLLIPAALATVLTISEGGYINEQGNHFDLDWVQLLLSPFAWSVVFLAIVSVLYISSGF